MSASAACGAFGLIHCPQSDLPRRTADIEQNGLATAQRDRKELARFGVNKARSHCKRLQFS